MWICLPSGFYSAVKDKDDPSGETLQIRTRAWSDAVYLRDWLKTEHGQDVAILRWEYRDYPWRLLVTKDLWGSFLVAAAEEIDYTNFKNQVAEINPARAKVYGRAWGVFYDIENEDGSRKRPPLGSWAPARPSRPSTLADLTGTGWSHRESELEPDVPTEVEVIDVHSGAVVGYRSIHDLTDAEWLEWDAMGSLATIIEDEEPEPRAQRKNGKSKKGKRGSRR